MVLPVPVVVALDEVLPVPVEVELVEEGVELVERSRTLKVPVSE